MLVEVNIVLRHNVVEPLQRLFDFNQLKDFQIVLGDFTSKCIGADIDYVHIGVFETEHPCDLRVLPLFVLVQTESLTFRNRVTIDVDFDSALRLDLRPAIFEFRLHFSPHLKRLLA
jgi:hypothetical protein